MPKYLDLDHLLGHELLDLGLAVPRQLLEHAGGLLTLDQLTGGLKPERIEGCRLRFNVDVVGAGATVTYTLDPGSPWKPTKLGIAPEVAPYFILRRIKIGVVDQLSATEIPAVIFSGPGGPDLGLDHCAPGVRISVEAENISDEPRPFRGWWDGHGPNALSIRGAEPIPVMRRTVIPFRIPRLDPGEHASCQIDNVAYPSIAERVIIPAELHAQGVQLVGAEFNGEKVALLTDERPGRTQIVQPVDFGSPTDRLVLTFGHAATGDRPQALEVKGAVIAQTEGAPPNVAPPRAAPSVDTARTHKPGWRGCGTLLELPDWLTGGFCGEPGKICADCSARPPK